MASHLVVQSARIGVGALAMLSHPSPHGLGLDAATAAALERARAAVAALGETPPAFVEGMRSALEQAEAALRQQPRGRWAWKKPGCSAMLRLASASFAPRASATDRLALPCLACCRRRLARPAAHRLPPPLYHLYDAELQILMTLGFAPRLPISPLSSPLIATRGSVRWTGTCLLALTTVSPLQLSPSDRTVMLPTARVQWSTRAHPCSTLTWQRRAMPPQWQLSGQRWPTVPSASLRTPPRRTCMPPSGARADVAGAAVKSELQGLDGVRGQPATGGGAVVWHQRRTAERQIERERESRAECGASVALSQ